MRGVTYVFMNAICSSFDASGFQMGPGAAAGAAEEAAGAAVSEPAGAGVTRQIFISLLHRSAAADSMCSEGKML